MSIAPHYCNDYAQDAQILKDAFNCSPGSILIIDPQEMQFIEANRTALSSLGYTREEFLKLSPADIYATPNAETLIKTFNSIIRSGEQYATFYCSHRKKDKSRYDAEVDFCCFEVNNKNYLLASATERSAWKKAKDKSYFALIFNSTVNAMRLLKVESDNKLRIEAANDVLVRATGMSRNELTGRLLEEVNFAAIKGGPYQYCTTCKCRQNHLPAPEKGKFYFSHCCRQWNRL
jgi:PAS domain S-box-containing protein